MLLTWLGWLLLRALLVHKSVAHATSGLDGSSLLNSLLKPAFGLSELLQAGPQTTPVDDLGEDVATTIREIVNQTCTFWNVTACAVGVSFNNTEIMANFGVLDKETQKPVDQSSLFQIGSATKAFTSMAALMRVAKGELNLDVPVAQYLPEFKLNASGSEGLTLRDLMSHRTGMPRHDLLWSVFLPQGRSEDVRKALVYRLQGLTLDKPIRYNAEYNNLMFITAGLVAGKGHKDGWEGFVAENILRPLNMHDSWLHAEDMSREAKQRFATPYTNDGTKVHELLPTEIVGPAGSIVSSTTDMLKWLGAHMEQLELKSPLLDTKTYSEIVHPNAPFPLLNVMFGTYTLGWWLEPLTTDMFLLHHGGNTNGFTAFNVIVLQLVPGMFGGKLPLKPVAGFTIQTNQHGSIAPTMLALQIMKLLTKLPLVSNLNELQWEAQAPARAAAAESLRKFKQMLHDGEHQPSKFTIAQLVGVYEHSAYGKVRVDVLPDGNMTLSLNGQTSHGLRHFWNDTFGYDLAYGYGAVNQATDPQMVFFGNTEGNVTRMESILEPAVAPIVFDKVTTSAMLDETAETVNLVALDKVTTSATLDETAEMVNLVAGLCRLSWPVAGLLLAPVMCWQVWG